jgi:predicted HNH restriction endonuclease
VRQASTKPQISEESEPISKQETKLKQDLNIFDKKENKEKLVETKKAKVTKKKTTAKKKATQKANEKFFDKVKEYLNQKGIEISGIEGFSKQPSFFIALLPSKKLSIKAPFEV